jgi:hypothetical protein
MMTTRDERYEFVRDRALRKAQRRAAFKARLKNEIKSFAGGRVWFWKPQWRWFGWATLLPFYRGHDEYSRETIVIGWTITGRVIIATHYCGDIECYEQTLRWHADDQG